MEGSEAQPLTMSSGMAGSFSEEDTYLFRLIKICTDVMQKYMHIVFKWGTSTRRPSENLFEYLSKKSDTNKTTEKLDEALGSKLAEIVRSDKSGSTYDVSLLYLCIMYGCDRLASPNDDKWRTPGSSLESLVYSTKKIMDELSYESKKINKIQFLQGTKNIERVLMDMLLEAGMVYGKDRSTIDEAVQNMCDEINNIRDSSLAPPNYIEYKKILLFVEQRVHTCQKVRVLLTDRYKLEIYVSPIPKLSCFKFRARNIYTNLNVRDIVGKLGDLIVYKDILKDQRKDRTYPVILMEAISGMGKTVLMKMIISDWISGHCEMKNLDRIELLLYVECKNSSIDTFQKLLQHLVPEVCQDFMGDDIGKVIKDLNTLVLIDGLDELNSASTTLLKELLYLKLHFGITLLATSRPDCVPFFYHLVDSLKMTIQHIHLDGIHSIERNNFVDRYHWEMINNGIKCQDVDDLKQTLQNKGNHLDEFLKNPYNLALTCILWNDNPPKIKVSTTPLELYYHIHQLTEEKLLERLQRHNFCQNLSSHILKGKVPHFTYALCKESFSCLKNDELILSEEAVKRLTDCCTHTKLPCDEMLSSFLQEDDLKSKSSNRRQMSFTHEGARDFLASLYIWFELGKNPRSNVDIYVDNLMKTASVHNEDPATTEKIKIAIRVAFSKLSKAPSEESTVIRDLLSEDGDITLGSKYQTLLINLLGIIYLKNRNRMESAEKEIFNLLKELGLKSRDRWLGVLNRVKCNDFVLMRIAEVPGVMEESVEINNSIILAYIQLFNLKQPESVNLKVTGDLCRYPCMKELFPLIKERGIKVKSVEIDNHNAQVLSEELDLKDLLFVDVSSKTDGSLSDVNEFIQKINRNGNGPKIRNLCLHYHYRNPTSPVQFGSVLNHLSKHYLGKEYVGPITESTTLPTTLRNISASVADLESYNNMCDMILKMKELKELSVCLPLILSHESLRSIDVCSQEQTSFICHIPDVQVKSAKGAACMIEIVTRDISYRCEKWMICFPRANIDGHGVKHLLKWLTSRIISRRLSVISFPKSCCISEDHKRHLQGFARKSLSCTLKWEEEEKLWDSTLLRSLGGPSTAIDDLSDIQRRKREDRSDEDSSLCPYERGGEGLSAFEHQLRSLEGPPKHWIQRRKREDRSDEDSYPCPYERGGKGLSAYKDPLGSLGEPSMAIDDLPETIELDRSMWGNIYPSDAAGEGPSLGDLQLRSLGEPCMAIDDLPERSELNSSRYQDIYLPPYDPAGEGPSGVQHQLRSVGGPSTAINDMLEIQIRERDDSSGEEDIIYMPNLEEGPTGVKHPHGKP